MLKKTIKGKIMSKLNYTVVAVIAFIIVLFFAMKAEAEGYIGLGKSTFNSHMMTGEAGYRKNNWDVGVQLIGAGQTKNGSNSPVWIGSVSHIVQPDWSIANYADLFMRLGVAYVRESNLVGDFNFRLGVGFDMELFEVELYHISSAGIWDNNTGIDGIMLRARF